MAGVSDADIKGARPEFAIRTMTPADVAFGMRVKEQAGWNQTESDWRHLIEYEPEGVFVAEHAASGRPVGTATTIRYGERFGWIGMILVDTRFRRRGIGTRLVNRCIEYLRDRGVETVKLDATPAGREVYLQLGFRDEWKLARFEGAAREADGSLCPVEPGRGIQPMRQSDLGEVAAYDAPRFGADRSRVLAGYLAGWPETCHVLRRAGGVSGFVTARRGARAHQIGPCVASEPGDNLALLRASLHTLAAARPGARVLMDVVTENDWARELAESVGLTQERPFTRMALGPNRYPGDFRATFLVACPELG